MEFSTGSSQFSVILIAVAQQSVRGRGPTLHYKDKILKRNKYSQERNCTNIHISVSDLYSPLIGLPILLQNLGIYRSITDTM
jgi:hypothetical protein